MKQWCENVMRVFTNWCENGDDFEREFMSDFASSMNALFPLLTNTDFKPFHFRVKGSK